MQVLSAKIASRESGWMVTELKKARSANGQFPKDFSGNPGGIQRDEQKFVELARS